MYGNRLLVRSGPRCFPTPFRRLPGNVRRLTAALALAMLAGLSVDGLPLSVQFVGRYFDEATLFQVARAWEQAAGTDKKRPTIV